MMDEWVYWIYVNHLASGEKITQAGNFIECSDMSFEFLTDGRVILRGLDDYAECPYEIVYNEYGVVDREIVWLKTGDRLSQGHLGDDSEWHQEYFDE